MKTIRVLCEGRTEVAFVVRVISPHIPSVIITAQNLGGHLSYAKLRKEIRRNLVSPSQLLRVTTLIDLHKLPDDFPRRADSVGLPPRQRVSLLAEGFGGDVDDRRFIPHLQLFEFESLILADLLRLIPQYPKQEREIRDLHKQLEKDFPDGPESINHQRPPSYWIRDKVPQYNKQVSAVATLEAIGLDAVRRRCPHFDRWLAELEQLAETSC
jgi:hypothetical protein